MLNHIVTITAKLKYIAKMGRAARGRSSEKANKNAPNSPKHLIHMVIFSLTLQR